MNIDPWFLKNLVCPRDRQTMRLDDDRLTCLNHHHYPVVQGVPVMLLTDLEQTWGGRHTMRQLSDWQEQPQEPIEPSTGSVDPYVQKEIVGTNGIMFKSLVGKLKEYPIPVFRAPRKQGESLLDIGCGWGRWCIAASRTGFQPIGIDANLGSVLAARRVAQQLGAQARFLVADARYLPFPENAFEFVFSYSVLQHFSKNDFERSLKQISRVLIPKGMSLVQMPNARGLRCLYHQIKRLYRTPIGHEVRYWKVGDLTSLFECTVGPTTLSVDGFFSINPQRSEAHLLPRRYRFVIYLSYTLRDLCQRVPALSRFADSVYIAAEKPASSIGAA